jgi:adenylosuccinate synthase
MTTDSVIIQDTGVHCVVDGQFGSTGKGALAAWVADYALRHDLAHHFSGAIYSGGPNSGHTFYADSEQVVVKQLPSFAAYLYMKGHILPAYLSAGAVIDPVILKEEANRFPNLPIFVHPNAAIVTTDDKLAEHSGSIAAVAGTRSGTGSALSNKILRITGAIAGNSLCNIAPNVIIQNHRLKPEQHSYFMEVAQGFSLGINSPFYPKVTSRECTVMQGLADARIPPKMLSEVYMAIRTFPIRVGNVDGHSSGNWYPDQQEVSWKDLNVEPELTTVTKRVRRVATFSMQQFYEACYANDPSFVFVSHMDYLSDADQKSLVDSLRQAREDMKKNFLFLFGYGPRVTDVSSNLMAKQGELSFL